MDPSIDPTASHRDMLQRLKHVSTLLRRAVVAHRQQAQHAQSMGGASAVAYHQMLGFLEGHADEADEADQADHSPDVQHAAHTYRDQPGTRLDHLRTAFDLTNDDMDLLLLALAPELSHDYAFVYAYLHNHPEQVVLTVRLALRVLRAEGERQLAVLSRLVYPSPLIHHGLVQVMNSNSPLSLREIKVEPALVRWVLHGHLTRHHDPTKGLERIETDPLAFLPRTVRTRIDQVTPSLTSGITCVLTGGTPGLRDATACTLAESAGRSLVRIDLDHIQHLLADRPTDLVRDLRLDSAIPFLVNAPASDDEPERRQRMKALGKALATLPFPICVGGTDRKAVASLLGAKRPTVTIPMGKSSLDERTMAWQQALQSRGLDGAQAKAIAERFYSLGGTTLTEVLDRAQAEAGGTPPTTEHLWAACRAASRPEFSGLAEVVIPRFGWSDIILSDRILNQLKQIEDHLLHQETVYQRWGADAIRPRGYGLKALFSGNPGTGKTMAAEVLAGALGLTLLKVDLSQVVSKWVGETQKNLGIIFDAAEGGSTIILFDEGDALFSARGESKSSQDRFANQEISFLLQRLESFEGCAIITTNLQDNIDSAFLRRFGIVVEFPQPRPAERLRLWERAIPVHAPRSDTINLRALAKNFPLSGGSIVNAALNACTMAAATGKPLCQEFLIIAVARELYKQGKQINSVYFGDDYALVQDLF